MANDDDSAGPPALRFVATSFNTGTTDGLPHDAAPDDGYGDEQAALSDTWYGDGLAWSAAVEDAAAFFASTEADIVGFQEIFWSDECAGIPVDAHAGFVCEQWQVGDPTVAQVILGDGWQVACHPGKTDKCLAVRSTLGRFANCEEDFCLEGLAGGQVDGCGSGSRVGRGVVELTDGGSLTVVNVHGSSGLSDDDKACRVAQFEQVFEDLGDGSGEPAANGESNLILGDLNTDPGRFLSDPSASYFADAAEAGGFGFHTAVGPDAVPTYSGLANIDHVLSDGFDGDCWAAGIDAGHPAVSDVIYFDHTPQVCALTAR